MVQIIFIKRGNEQVRDREGEGRETNLSAKAKASGIFCGFRWMRSHLLRKGSPADKAGWGPKFESRW